MKFFIKERLIDPNSPDRRPRKAAYALPALFTAGNLFLGFLAIVRTFQGAMMIVSTGQTGRNSHLEAASLMIGVAVFLDGLDGRIARMTNTMSDFGRELDSLADVITFGIAPAILAWVYGFQFMSMPTDPEINEHLHRAGYFVTFLFLMCGASRLARFNIQTNPIPKNPGRPDRKYFVGVPIPAAAALIAAIVYAGGGIPLQWWPLSVGWLALLFLLSFLMVSTWRYRSFKDFNMFSPRSPVSVVMFGTAIYLIWNYSQAMLLAMAGTYVGSGIVIRIGGVIKRRWRAVHATPQPQVNPNG